MHVMMCFNMDIDLDPRSTGARHSVRATPVATYPQTSQRSTRLEYSLVWTCIDQVVQVNSPTHRRAVDLPGYGVPFVSKPVFVR